MEEADDNAPSQRLIPVTAEELNGHLKREEERSTAAGRPMLHLYKQLPLTSAIQSMMPMYRRSDSFGRIDIPDEFGYYPEAATQHSEKQSATQHSEHDGWLAYRKEYACDPTGEITGSVWQTTRLLPQDRSRMIARRGRRALRVTSEPASSRTTTTSVQSHA